MVSKWSTYDVTRLLIEDLKPRPWRPPGSIYINPASTRFKVPALEFDPELHERELKCARIFLQRYATWCVRKKRFAEAGGAANLSRRLRESREAAASRRAVSLRRSGVEDPS
jgi:hypothetical protein